MKKLKEKLTTVEISDTELVRLLAVHGQIVSIERIDLIERGYHRPGTKIVIKEAE